MSTAERFYELQPTGTIIRSEGDHWGRDANAKRLTLADGKRKLAQSSREELLKILKPGDTVLCVLRHVSRSGMYRVIDFYKSDPKGGDPRYLSGHMLNLGIGERARGGKDGVGVGGCGMDMGFHCVYELGHKLWPKGTAKPHGRRNGEPDSDGGYALKHRWL
jgi:hypothetical protein